MSIIRHKENRRRKELQDRLSLYLYYNSTSRLCMYISNYTEHRVTEYKYSIDCNTCKKEVYICGINCKLCGIYICSSCICVYDRVNICKTCNRILLINKEAGIEKDSSKTTNAYKNRNTINDKDGNNKGTSQSKDIYMDRNKDFLSHSKSDKIVVIDMINMKNTRINKKGNNNLISNDKEKDRPNNSTNNSNITKSSSRDSNSTTLSGSILKYYSALKACLTHPTEENISALSEIIKESEISTENGTVDRSIQKNILTRAKIALCDWYMYKAKEERYLMLFEQLEYLEHIKMTSPHKDTINAAIQDILEEIARDY
ncbi:hypothetical protein NERG_01218 [Nematocida ausubeli]|uniref:Uncharacterized protein n=1 Tax=Nematocida ausubeli (strain ATCC PRA-371 / ERTm2) TaxID=1913371 RepID=H8ZBX5_NEMA1|nr:hypothetical protein NERG_01218 [Nematocida ausubeli]